MIIKIIIVLLLLFILFNLFRALFIMVSGKTDGRPMSHYLGRRVLFSVIVLVIVIAALKLGFIHSNSSPIDKVTAHIQTQINTTTPHQQNANTKLRLETQNVYLG
ncbi:DUF2909 domain-containing protein [Pseudoalteromonas sp. SG43-7]|uniref:DUF2909 domain-containing protein n=1 Tax=Pseudoalteromonas arctica TaxID=394751 RepID=A0A7Y0DSB9_9GAMM|nr:MULTISPECIES: DUF2909 domain-containing protein [unclassified Pseudoalteromonas]NMM40694.1 DUF2909 domain-containing protein [Pseudoalteromonas arctica]MBB1341917.1 DUF2909 domain-containing protein [Pseudoalteromonas sp. SR45-6]MBB1410032.1 DUF2909 domain-containing protein [Pseudoalteromonas sp. SG44-17]MBB1418235.1 DUF2909 domain-containing protein [Pseudoalteromonas sp. SG44-1]MBB1421751.1 DUF2909 domain-containing protein [Pseudoalteromonas sp. SG43-7]